MNNGAFLRPCDGPIHSRAGYRPGIGAFDYHYGVDMGQWDWAVRSMFNGVVVAIQTYAVGDDYAVNVRHNGFLTRYRHLRSVAVKVGDRLTERNRFIGRIGYRRAPHVHVEIHNGEVWRGNPSANITRINNLLLGTPNDGSSNPRNRAFGHVSAGVTPAISDPRPTPTPPVLEGDVMTPREFWSYGNDQIQKGRQAFNFLRRAADDSEDVQKRIRRNDWRRWLASGIVNRRIAPLKALTDRWNIRDDGYLLGTWIQYTYLQARMARQNGAEAFYLARDNNAMLTVMAEELDALHSAQGKLLAAVKGAQTAPQAMATLRAEIAADDSAEDGQEDTTDDDQTVIEKDEIDKEED